MQADGNIGTTPMEVGVLSGAVTLLVPENSLPENGRDLDKERIKLEYYPGYVQNKRAR